MLELVTGRDESSSSDSSETETYDQGQWKATQDKAGEDKAMEGKATEGKASQQTKAAQDDEQDGNRNRNENPATEQQTYNDHRRRQPRRSKQRRNACKPTEQSRNPRKLTDQSCPDQSCPEQSCVEQSCAQKTHTNQRSGNKQSNRNEPRVTFAGIHEIKPQETQKEARQPLLRHASQVVHSHDAIYKHAKTLTVIEFGIRMRVINEFHRRGILVHPFETSVQHAKEVQKAQLTLFLNCPEAALKHYLYLWTLAARMFCRFEAESKMLFALGQFFPATHVLQTAFQHFLSMIGPCCGTTHYIDIKSYTK
jgi:uncharacterized low-complexity protein